MTAPGTQTPGRRVYLPESGEFSAVAFAEGDFAYNPHDEQWYVRPPGAHLGCLDGHEVTVHQDGSITVSPSIDGPGFHGFLERGVWRAL